jgi:hypothetical protein
VAREVYIEGDELIRAVGTSHYQPALLAACGVTAADKAEIRADCRATLVPEPDNPHDPGAVAVRVGGEKVGYLARDEHPRWRAVVDQLAAHGAVAAVDARIAGRGGMVGLFLRLPTPTEAQAQVGIALREARG